MAHTNRDGEDRANTASDAARRAGPVPATFTDLLNESHLSAVHLEQRDIYTPWDADYLRWTAGDHFDPLEWGSGWIDLIADAIARGVEVRRLRIVSEPVTDYIRYEHGVTAMNIAAGEQVRWLPRRSALDLLIPVCDFWVFDRRMTQFNHFAGDGSPLGPENSDSHALADVLAGAFDRAWERAIPHEEYKPL